MLSELDNFGHFYQKQPSSIVLKIYNKFAGEYTCQSAISIMLQSNFIETTLRRGCFAENLPHTFGTPLPKKNFFLGGGGNACLLSNISK